MRYSALLTVCMAISGGALQAQTNPTVAETKQAYAAIKNNLSKMAEKMPEENYSFKPVPEIRTFGELVAHVADNQVRTCSAVTGSGKQPGAAAKKTKAELVTALKDAFAECDAAFDSVNDTTAFQTIKTARGERSRLGALIVFIVAHDNEEYGYMAVYMRLKGIVPPSSEGR